MIIRTRRRGVALFETLAALAVAGLALSAYLEALDRTTDRIADADRRLWAAIAARSIAAELRVETVERLWRRWPADPQDPTARAPAQRQDARLVVRRLAALPDDPRGLVRLRLELRLNAPAEAPPLATLHAAGRTRTPAAVQGAGQ